MSALTDFMRTITEDINSINNMHVGR